MQLDSVIKDSKAEQYDLQDLTVLNTAVDPYRFNTTGHRENAEWFAKLIERFLRSGQTVHLRGLHYRITTSGDVEFPALPTSKRRGAPPSKKRLLSNLYVNADEHYYFLCKASFAARWLGLIPFDRIIDQKNEPPEIFVPEDEEPGFCLYSGSGVEVPAIARLAPRFISAFNSRQKYRIALFGEKSSLGPVLRPIAERIGAELLLPSGEISTTLIYGLVKRAYEDGRPLVVLYFSDFDPSGYQMPVSVARKIQAFRDFQLPDLDAQLHRVALTLDQVREFDLPSTPLKKTEERDEKWKAAMQHEQTEIDALCALKPELLAAIAEEAIRPFYDETLNRREVEAMLSWSEDAAELLESHPSYAEQFEIITEAHRDLQNGSRRLAMAQRRAYAILSEVQPPDIAPPEQVLDQDAPEPIFTTDDDFAGGPSH